MSHSKEVQFLRPDQIIAERDGSSLIFLPIGPLEWHGPHLPLGVDPLRAEFACKELAEDIGGIVMPTLYCGTERERSSEMLKNIGFNGDEHVVGMDFPDTTLKSHYFNEEVFAIVLRNQLELLIDVWKFRNVIVINGHGAENHLGVISRLITEFENSREVNIIFCMPMKNYPDSGWGHATLEETETLMAQCEESIDLDMLPPKGEPLINTKWAIVDDAGFRGGAPAVGEVCDEEDPRNADIERGSKMWAETIAQLGELITKEL